MVGQVGLFSPHYHNSWALCIGINAYQHMPPLCCAVKDAQDVAQLLINRWSFESERVKLLLDEDASRENILAVFDNMLNQHNLAPDDRILIFFAGHGLTRDTAGGGKVGYIAPVDARPGAWRTLIPMSGLIDQARFLPAKHILFIMDACYSGLSFQRGRQADLLVEHFLTQRAVQLITAGREDEQVVDGGDPEGDNSIFTGYLLEALSGKAATASGLMTASDVMSYVYNRVIHDPDTEQNPQFGWVEGDGDFVFQWPQVDGLPADLEIKLRLGSVPARLMALYDLTTCAGSDTPELSRLALKRIQEVAEYDPDPRVRHTALRIMGADESLSAPHDLTSPHPPLKLGQRAGSFSWLRFGLPLSLMALLICAGLFSVLGFAFWRGTSADQAAKSSEGSAPGKEDSARTTSDEPEVTQAISLLSPSPTSSVEDIGNTILFEDNFSVVSSRWGPGPSDWRAVRRFENGYMSYEIHGPYGLWLALPTGIRVYDAVVSVEATLIRPQPGAGYGLIFHLVDFDNYYYYRINPEGSYALLLQEAGSFRYLIAPSDLGTILVEDEPHRLAVRLDGDIITLFFDDQELVEIDNHRFAYGNVGIAIQALDETPVKVAFDNFRVALP